jgi:hypothetical protein
MDVDAVGLKERSQGVLIYRGGKRVVDVPDL